MAGAVDDDSMAGVWVVAELGEEPASVESFLCYPTAYAEQGDISAGGDNRC